MFPPPRVFQILAEKRVLKDNTITTLPLIEAGYMVVYQGLLPYRAYLTGFNEDRSGYKRLASVGQAGVKAQDVQT